jgi:uncharacterized protein (DUF169 family)
LDYSERDTRTQGQLPQKCGKNGTFFGTVWKMPLFKRLFGARRRMRSAPRVTLLESRLASKKNRGIEKMVSGTSWPRLGQALEQRIVNTVKLARRPVAVAFLDAAPSGLEQFQGTEPAGCSFWRLAAAGKSFFTVPENHFNCAVGAYTHNIPLSPAREKETEQTLKMMFDLGYVKPEDVPQIPRLSKTPSVIAYAPLGDCSFDPDTVVFACKPAGAMLLNESASRAGIASGAPALGRPTCMALPASLEAGSILSLGCVGNRLYTGLGADELYFVVRGKDLSALADALDVIARANHTLQQYALGRQTELATA